MRVFKIQEIAASGVEPGLLFECVSALGKIADPNVLRSVLQRWTAVSPDRGAAFAPRAASPRRGRAALPEGV